MQRGINISRFDYKDVTYVSKQLSLGAVNYLIDSACVRLCAWRKLLNFLNNVTFFSVVPLFIYLINLNFGNSA